VLFEWAGDEAIQNQKLAPIQGLGSVELSAIRKALGEASGTPLTTSAGRLFDAIASLVGLRQQVNFEGQAGMELEFAIEHGIHNAYQFDVENAQPLVVDWRPMIGQVVEDLSAHEPTGRIAARFHNTLAQIVLAVALRVKQQKVVLTGGCFQNRYLTERCVDLLQSAGFRAYWHQRVPPNDGGISLGQVIAAGRFAKQYTSATQRVVA
jgi:hydrogenase maturation protein HypF